jgi:hypothetical protein
MAALRSAGFQPACTADILSARAPLRDRPPFYELRAIFADRRPALPAEVALN